MSAYLPGGLPAPAPSPDGLGAEFWNGLVPGVSRIAFAVWPARCSVPVDPSGSVDER